MNYNISLINRVFKDDLIIPEFYNFIPYIETIYTKCKRNLKGHVRISERGREIFT